MTGRAYRGMVRTEHRGPGGGYAGVVAAGLVPIAEFLRHLGQVEAEREHQRVRVAAATLASRVRLLQNPPGGGRVVGLPMQAGEKVAGGQHVGMVIPVRRSGGADRVGEQATGGGQISRGAQGEGLMLRDGQGGGMGHMSNAARNQRLDATRRARSGSRTRYAPSTDRFDLRKRSP